MIDSSNIYSLVMAGGSGTRFWPLSRPGMPKQLLNLSGKDVMINETIMRCSGIINMEDTFIVTNINQVEPLETVLLKSVPRGNILAEPMAKNTAPCLLYSTMYILETRGDGVICVFPADHYITDEARFREVLRQAAETAATQDNIVTIGIKPTHPSTGYGYIKINEEPSGSTKPASALEAGSRKDCTDGYAYPVEKFVEKPTIEKATEYIKDGSYYWNAGIFICKASVLLELFKRFLPKMVSAFDGIKGSFGKSSCPGASLEPGNKKPLEDVYKNLDSISIDYGIMERADNTVLVKGDFGWNDIGSWDALGAVFPKDEHGNVIRGEHLGIDTGDCVIYGQPGKVIATIGVKDLVVADTGDALLVCHKSKTQDVKNIIAELNKS